MSQICLIGFALAMLLQISDMQRFTVSQVTLEIKHQIKGMSRVLIYFYYPLLIWLFTLFLSCFFGLQLGHSLKTFFKFSAYFLLPLLVLLHITRSRLGTLTQFSSYIFLMCVGQGIAALHSIVSTVIGSEINIGLPGAVTEAGQIALLFPVLLAAVYRTVVLKGSADPVFSARKNLLYVLFFIISIALVVNLKRGPWLSVFTTSTLFFLIFSLRNILLVFVVSALVCFLPPVWNRIIEFKDHFYIVGGRFDMWKLGFQLIERYPLGIGFGNSDMMRKFDPTLPLLHRHMHNTVLNITLESGIFSGLLYIWWFYRLLAQGISQIGGRAIFVRDEFLASNHYYALSILLSILGMQVAGIVEYNFGDGEIRYLFLVLMGFLLSLLLKEKGVPNGRVA